VPTRNKVQADYHTFVSDGIDGDKVKEDARKRLKVGASTVIHYHAQKVECTDDELMDFFGPVIHVEQQE
jgi:hypothetical protein